MNAHVTLLQLLVGVGLWALALGVAILPREAARWMVFVALLGVVALTVNIMCGYFDV